MSPLDWIILGCYCALIVGLAVHFQKRASGGLVEFFAAGRDLPWWVIGLADVAGYTGGGQSFVMLLFLSGYSGLWLMAWLSWVIWMPLVAIIWAPMWRRLGVLTTGEFIERRYAGRTATNYRTIYALYACTAWGMTSIAYAAAWMAATAGPVLGWPTSRVLLVFGGITVLYTLIAGLLAVAYNDVLQFAILMAGNLVFGVILVNHAGGMQTVWAKVGALRGEQFLSAWPSGSGLSAITIVALCVQGLFFAGSPFAGEGWTAQRFMAARDERHAIAGQISNGILALVVRLIPFILIALAAAALYSPAQVTTPAALWGHLVHQYAPAGLIGLLLVSSLAGYMAAISSIGNWAASYLVNDIYARRINPSATRSQLVSVSRIATAALLCVAFAVGAVIRTDQLDKWVLFINSSLVVFSLPLAWLKWFWWRTNALADMAGVLGGFPVGYLVWFGSDACLPSNLRNWLTQHTHWDWNGIVPAFSDLQKYPFWMGFGVLFLSGWVTITSVALLTRPEPLRTLAEFYRTARPLGSWTPVRHLLSPEERPRAGEEIATSAAGILYYFSLVTTLFELMGGHFAACAVSVTVSALAGILFYKGSRRTIARSMQANQQCRDSQVGTP